MVGSLEGQGCRFQEPLSRRVPDRIVANKRVFMSPNFWLWILQVLAGQQWRSFFVADVSAAFNQSETNMRTKPLHMRLSPGGLPGLPVHTRMTP
eukprot:896992-Amphidinium_carterae.2